jgi:hypothetical protein
MYGCSQGTRWAYPFWVPTISEIPYLKSLSPQCWPVSVSTPAGGWQVRPVDEAQGRRACIPSKVALVDMNITQKSAQAWSLTVLGSALRFRPSSMSSMSFPPFYCKSDPSFAGAFSTLTSTIDTYTELMSALYVGDSRQIIPLPLAVPPA